MHNLNRMILYFSMEKVQLSSGDHKVSCMSTAGGFFFGQNRTFLIFNAANKWQLAGDRFERIRIEKN